MRIKLDALRAAIKAADDAKAGSLVERRATLLTEAQAVLKQLQALDDPATDDPEALDAVKSADDVLDRLKATAKAAEKSADTLRRLGKSNPDGGTGRGGDGDKYLALTNPHAVKSAARAMAAKMTGPDPLVKALVPTGTAVDDVPMVGVYEQPDLPTSLLDLVPMRPVPANWFYLKETGRVDNAAVVAPGEEKPVSEYSLERRDDHLRPVAHLAGPIDKYVLEDGASVEQFVERRMYAGLRRGIEAALLNGDGEVSAGPPRTDNVTGLLVQSGIQSQPYLDGLLNTIRRAITRLERLGYVARAVVLSPDDWELLETTRREGDGAFDLGPANLPVDRAKRTVWGVQVVVSVDLPAKTGIVADTAVIDFVGDGRIALDWNPYTGFTRNELEVRCETRIGVGLTNALGVVKVETRV